MIEIKFTGEDPKELLSQMAVFAQLQSSGSTQTTKSKMTANDTQVDANQDEETAPEEKPKRKATSSSKTGSGKEPLIDQIKKAAFDASEGGFKAELKALLVKYDATKLSEVAVADQEEFLVELKELTA